MEWASSELFVGWRIVAGAFCIYFVEGGLFNSGTVYFKAVASDLDLGRGQLSGVFSLGFLVAGLAAPVWGRVVDRRGPRAAFVPGAILTGAACVALSRSSDLASLSVLYVLFMFCSAGISLIPVSVVVSNWFVKKRGRAMGVAYMGEGFGAFVLVPIAGVLVTSVGWRSAYIISGVAVTALLTPVALWMKNRPEDVGQYADGEGPVDAGAVPGTVESPPVVQGWSRRDAMRTPAFWMVAAAWMIAMMPLMAVTLHQVPFLTDSGLSVGLAALLAGVAGGAGIVGRLGFGLLSEHYPIRPIYASCYVLMGLGIAALWATSTLGTPALAAYVIFFGIAVGGAFALAGLLVADIFGDVALGELFGLLGLAATIGGALGATGAGLLFDRVGNYDIVFAACIVMSALSTILMLLVPQPNLAGSASS